MNMRQNFKTGRGAVELLGAFFSPEPARCNEELSPGFQAMTTDIVLALFAAVTRAIPAIGPVVSGVPIVLVGLFTMGPATAAWLLVFVTL